MTDLQQYSTMAQRGPKTDFDAVVVGAGFAGLYMLYKLRELGFSAQVFEAGSGVGGTWFWNRYPGARCDVESMEYSYQFSEELQQEWCWSERYAGQPEILRYINHVADRFDLRSGVRFNTRVLAAVFDEASGRWSIETDDGARVTAQFCVMATGCLSSANLPKFKGRDAFAGESYHTGNWPQEGVNFSGKRVGIIGTGSSAIQAIPLIAEEAEHLYVFQRTPNYSIPARNGPLDREMERKIKAEYAAFRARNSRNSAGLSYVTRDVSALDVSSEDLKMEYEKLWAVGGLAYIRTFKDLLLNREANESAARFVRERIHEIVSDPIIAEALCPEQVIGCKRLCLDTGYYKTYNRDNVSLVDISRSQIREISEAGIKANGQLFELDCIVFATGFDAMTGALTRIDIRGDLGQTLRDKWAAGPRTYLGIGTAGFPNLFTITGPGSPSVLANMLPAIEQHVNWVAACMEYMRERNLDRIVPDVRAEDAWVAHVNSVAHQTLYPECNSWYLGANIPGKTRVFMPYVGYPAYVRRCQEVAYQGYEGFVLS